MALSARAAIRTTGKGGWQAALALGQADGDDIGDAVHGEQPVFQLVGVSLQVGKAHGPVYRDGGHQTGPVKLTDNRVLGFFGQVGQGFDFSADII